MKAGVLTKTCVVRIIVEVEEGESIDREAAEEAALALLRDSPNSKGLRFEVTGYDAPDPDEGVNSALVVCEEV